jgi:DUF4097 and DUF4098 domain-containing protein YvlB
MEERMRILNMLKEGKINSEEAARLLDALEEKQSESKHRQFIFHKPSMAGFQKHFMRDLENIPEIVSKAVSDCCSVAVGKVMENDEKTEQKFPFKDTVAIRSVSGDIEIEGDEKLNEIVLECCGGIQKNEELEKELIFNTLSSDLVVRTPVKVSVKAATVSGDVEIKNINGEIKCESVSGDCQAKNISGKINAKSVSGDLRIKEISGDVNMKTASGDVDLELVEFDTVKIESKSGDITIELPDKTDAILELESEEGEIEISIKGKYEKIEEKQGYVKIGLGDKSHALYAKTYSGDIKIM